MADNGKYWSTQIFRCVVLTWSLYTIPIAKDTPRLLPLCRFKTAFQFRNAGTRRIPRLFVVNRSVVVREQIAHSHGVPLRYFTMVGAKLIRQILRQFADLQKRHGNRVPVYDAVSLVAE